MASSKPTKEGLFHIEKHIVDCCSMNQPSQETRVNAEILKYVLRLIVEHMSELYYRNDELKEKLKHHHDYVVTHDSAIKKEDFMPTTVTFEHARMVSIQDLEEVLPDCKALKTYYQTLQALKELYLITQEHLGKSAASCLRFHEWGSRERPARTCENTGTKPRCAICAARIILENEDRVDPISEMELKLNPKSKPITPQDLEPEA